MESTIPARDGAASSPCRPRAAIRFGVVGHVHLADADVPRLESDCLSLLAELRDAAERCVAESRPLYAPDPIQCRLICNLAPGFDQLAARAWAALASEPRGADSPVMTSTWVLPRGAADARFAARAGSVGIADLLGDPGLAPSRVDFELGAGATDDEADWAAARFSDAPPSWMRWYHDAVVRAADPAWPSRALAGRRLLGADLAGLGRRIRLGWIEDQRDYYQKAGPRYAALHARVERWVEGLFRCVLFAAAASTLAVAVMAYDAEVHVFPHEVPFVLLGIGAVFPALAACLHGLASQLEAVRLGSNYKRMARALQHSGEAFAEAESPGAGFSSAEQLERLEVLAREASVAMLTEMDEWHAAARTHPAPRP